MRNHYMVAPGLLALLGGTPVWLTWREVRQERPNASLIAAVRRRDVDGVVAALKEGASPNARDAGYGEITPADCLRRLDLR